MSIANTEQAKHWNTGPGVAHWVANQARYDRMHAPFTALILRAAALRAGLNVLDVGCGSGGTTLAAARLVAPGRALGLDLSGPMLARAQADAEAAGLDNVAFRQGDAQVEPLEPGRFDTVISRFGVMFFADPVAAFANIRSATRPGGRLVFACWQPLEQLRPGQVQRRLVQRGLALVDAEQGYQVRSALPRPEQVADPRQGVTAVLQADDQPQALDVPVVVQAQAPLPFGRGQQAHRVVLADGADRKLDPPGQIVDGQRFAGLRSGLSWGSHG